MLEYIAFGAGASIAVGQYFLVNRKLEREFDKFYGEHKEVHDRLMTTLDNEESMSKLVACFDNSDYKKLIIKHIDHDFEINGHTLLNRKSKNREFYRILMIQF